MKNSLIRTLARSHEWQYKFHLWKEYKVPLFENERDFTRIQLIFIKYLEMYNNLYMDIAMKEENITEKTLENDIFCDAYIYYRDNVKSNKNKEDNDEGSDKISVKFVKPKKVQNG